MLDGEHASRTLTLTTSATSEGGKLTSKHASLSYQFYGLSDAVTCSTTKLLITSSGLDGVCYMSRRLSGVWHIRVVDRNWEHDWIKWQILNFLITRCASHNQFISINVSATAEDSYINMHAGIKQTNIRYVHNTCIFNRGVYVYIERIQSNHYNTCNILFLC